MIDVGFVGLGHNGMAHIEAHLRLGRSRVGALCDRDPARLAGAGERFGVKRRYRSVAELCADQGLRAVSINTGDRDHVEPFLQALKHRKHVLADKPLANSPEEDARHGRGGAARRPGKGAARAAG
jgi:predicted dehydrogenase